MRYVLVKCSFEKLLEVAEKLKHKMPIAKNDLNELTRAKNYKAGEIDDIRKLIEEENCFIEFWMRIKNLDTLTPKEIKRYYYEADASMEEQHHDGMGKVLQKKELQINLIKYFSILDEKNENNTNENVWNRLMSKIKREVDSRKYFTAPYLSQMKEKFVLIFDFIYLHTVYPYILSHVLEYMITVNPCNRVRARVQLENFLMSKIRICIFAKNATFQLDKWTRVQRSIFFYIFLIKIKIIRFL